MSCFLFGERRAKNMKHCAGAGRARPVSSIRLLAQLPSGLLVDASIFVTNSRRVTERALTHRRSHRLRSADMRRGARLLRQEAVLTWKRSRPTDETCSILSAVTCDGRACVTGPIEPVTYGTAAPMSLKPGSVRT